MKKEKKEIRCDHLAGLLRNARVSKGLSQLEVSQQVGDTSPQQLSNLERGVTNPPYKTIKKLAELYGISSLLVIQAIVRDVQEIFQIDIF